MDVIPYFVFGFTFALTLGLILDLLARRQKKKADEQMQKLMKDLEEWKQ